MRKKNFGARNGAGRIVPWQWAMVVALVLVLAVLLVIGVSISLKNGEEKRDTTIGTQQTQPDLTAPSQTDSTESTPPQPSQAPQYQVTITLLGESHVVIEVGSEYVDMGAQAQAVSDSDPVVRPVTATVANAVDSQTLGTYQVVYTAEYEGVTETAVRTVQVVDTTAPVITLRPQQTPTPFGGEYVEDGFTAVDNYDGDITDRVQRLIDGDKVIYTVTDSSGNAASTQRVIVYAEMEGPVLSLMGPEQITIQAGTQWQEPGYTAMDRLGVDLTAQVQVTGKVDWYTAGTYVLTYRVVDSAGKSAEATRTVVVQGVRQPDEVEPDGKVIYLTFDDGPDQHTKRLLEILERYNVKVTFFVCDTENMDLLDDIVAGGHTLGLHSLTHDYEKIYSSEEAYFKDLYALQEIVYQKTGVRSKILRFPGGSSNRVSKKYCQGIMTRLAKAVQDQGFCYFDWHVDSDDAGNTKTAEGVAQNVINGVKKRDISVVLQHDIKGYSVDAVEKIILWGLENGYTFLPLDETSPDCHHNIKN